MKRIYNYLLAPRYSFNRFQLNIVALILLTIGFVSGSYFTINKIIQTFALNDTTKTWSFNAGTATDYTAATTIMTVDADGTHPAGGVDGANEITNPAFVANNNSWTLTALQSATDTPAGWAVVPGNSSFVATNSAFLAMKYEAKCANSGTPTVGLTTPADATYEVYQENGVAGDQCTAANGRVVTSLTSGYPIAYVSQTEAATRCSTVSVNSGSAHLITNDEWMTIANNAEQVPANWSLGAVGSGYLFNGHNDNGPAKARVASTTDTGDYRCAYTDTAGTTEAPTSCPTNTANNTSGTAGNQVRVLTLSNGQPIWDFAGNVWEWTNNTVLRKDQPLAWDGSVDDGTGFNWSDFTSGSLARYLHNYKAGSIVQQANTEPASSSYPHNAKYGIGRIYHYSLSGDTDTTNYAFLRGGGVGTMATTPVRSHWFWAMRRAVGATTLAFAAPVIP